MSKNQETEVTVKDRRMFNADGSLRQPLPETDTTQQTTESKENKASEENKESKENKAAKTINQAEENTLSRTATPSPEFSNLVEMLATNAIMHLGAAPQLGGRGVDIETARHFIEMLSALKEKTEGNLTEEEEKILNDMVSRLRMEYVAVVNQMSKSAKKQHL
ncbi:MAG: DUF1844 domain-containing protein [Acidobacteria bacterium]|nr:DUF1844 domain-containing protein [Acidobacteriota bacterium]